MPDDPNSWKAKEWGSPASWHPDDSWQQEVITTTSQGPSGSATDVRGPQTYEDPYSVSDPDEHPSRSGGLLQWVVVAAVSALIGGGVGAFAAQSDDDEGITAAGPTSGSVAPANASNALASPSSIRGVLSKVQPAVVTIEVDTAGGIGTGTGMIITPDGQILTNAHVIGDGRDISVTLNGDRQPKSARLLGKDESIDSAVIKLDSASDLPTVEFGDSTSVQVGDQVVAIGNALALAGGPSVTTGIVSAKDRSIPEPNGAVLDGLIQTDAAINFGNSGGPLSNMAGQVIGMNTAVIRGSEGEYQNIGFALSINSVKPALADLIAGKTSQPGYLGVNPETVTEEIRQLYDLTPSEGAVVSTVQRNSPASRAGLARFDVITEFGGQPVTSAEDLVGFVRSKKPGDRVPIVYFRGEDERTVTVTIDSRPS